MKTIRLIRCLIALVVACGSNALLRAADEPAPAKKPDTVDREKLRQELQNLPPEERRKKLQEMREQRQQQTPEQREAQRKQMRERMDKRLADLQKKKTDGTITEQETKQLERLEQMKKRQEQGGGPQGAQPRRRPQGDKQPAPPDKPAAPDKQPAAPPK